jgi:hypothetical protein
VISYGPITKYSDNGVCPSTSGRRCWHRVSFSTCPRYRRKSRSIWSGSKYTPVFSSCLQTKLTRLGINWSTAFPFVCVRQTKKGQPETVQPLLPPPNAEEGLPGPSGYNVHRKGRTDSDRPFEELDQIVIRYSALCVWWCLDVVGKTTFATTVYHELERSSRVSGPGSLFTR